MENKFVLNIDGTEYEFMDEIEFVGANTPVIDFEGKKYLGKAIKKESTIPDKDRDWEVIKYIGWHNLIKDTIFYKSGSELFYPFGVITNKGYNENYLKEHATDIKIHSVRRISDNEVFSIGDKVKWLWIWSEAAYFVIKSFEIDNENRLLINFTNGESIIFDIVNKMELKKVLEETPKPKVPLFTTDKNEPVYYMDKFWIVDNLGSYKEWFCAKVKLSGKNPNHKYFLTEQEADEYILNNKPIEVTMKEIEELLCNAPYDLKAFFKSKINL